MKETNLRRELTIVLQKKKAIGPLNIERKSKNLYSKKSGKDGSNGDVILQRTSRNPKSSWIKRKRINQIENDGLRFTVGSKYQKKTTQRGGELDLRVTGSKLKVRR